MLGVKTETLEEYKLKQYMDMGFTEYQSRRLVDVSGLNTAQVRDVIKKGCKVNIAYRIFRP